MSNKIVSDPVKLVTSKFKPLEIVYNHAGFVIAKGIWENRYMAIACRWHEKDGLGYPNGFGHQQWFLLPGDIKSSHKDISRLIGGRYKESLSIEFESYTNSVHVLSWQDTYREIINYGIINNAIETETIDYSNSDISDDFVVIHNVNLIDIPFFFPYVLPICNEDRIERVINGEKIIIDRQIVYSYPADSNCISSFSYGITIEKIMIPLPRFLELGYKLSDIPAIVKTLS